MPRFYVAQPLHVGLVFDLPEGNARHVQVLRMQPGEDIVLFDGRGGEYAAQITAMGKRNVGVEIMAYDPAECESPLQLTLVQAVSAAERMDYTVQKATELGVNVIQPVISQYCQQRYSGERAEKRIEHWLGIAAAAAEQSGRTRIPEIKPIMSFDQYLQAGEVAGLKLLLCPTGAVRWNSLPPAAQSVAMLVGPEGGFSAAEDAAALAAGFTPLLLGPRILRTETVAPAACALLQARYGDLL